MKYVQAKLIKDDISKHRQYRTLYKVSPENYDFDTLMAIAARQIPADAIELDVLMNAPTIYIYPIIRLCQLREISLTLIHRADEDWKSVERFPVLRFWTCSICDGRFSVSHSTCPYCGGHGYYMALPIPEDPIEELIEQDQKFEPEGGIQ